MSHRKADNLLLFKSIVDAGSLSTAAKICNISISQVSKRMTYLEKSLGLQLLQRSTRKLTLTHPGKELYEKLSSIKAQIDEAWQSLLEYGSEPRGDLKIAAPITYGTHKLMPVIKNFKQQHPKINVRFELTNSEQPEELNSDICFQSHIIGQNQLIPDSNLCAKKVESEPLIFVASKAYLEKHGIPEHPEELHQHKCLTINHEKTWSFYQDKITKTQAVDVEFSANNFKSLHHAALTGLGITQIPQSLLEANDGLVVLFSHYTSNTLDTYAYFQPGQLSLKKISLFLDQLQDR